MHGGLFKVFPLGRDGKQRTEEKKSKLELHMASLIITGRFFSARFADNGFVDMDSADEERSQQSVRASDNEPMLFCPRCNSRLMELKCKLICEKCGYYMSCADYY
jgi:hypothetical protein